MRCRAALTALTLATIHLCALAQAPAAEQAPRPEPPPVFEYRPGQAMTAKGLDWSLGQGIRVEMSLAFAGFERGSQLVPLVLSGVDGRGKPTSLGLSFRNDARLFIYVLPSDIDSWPSSSQAPRGSTDTWIAGETHHISAGMDPSGGLLLFADSAKANPHAVARDRSLMPAKITGVTVTDALGKVESCRIWLSAEGVGPRPNAADTPIKLIPETATAVLSPDVGLPLHLKLGVNDVALYKRSGPSVVVECPEGIAPYREMSIHYASFGDISYGWYRKDKDVFRDFERDGRRYTRYIFNIPFTPGAVERMTAGGFYPGWIALRTNLPEGEAPPVYMGLAWKGGEQPLAKVNVRVARFVHGGFQFKHLPASLWGNPFAPDIRNYCLKLGLNRVITNMAEGDRPGYSPMLQEARALLGPDIALDMYSDRIWWRRGLAPWPEEFAFRDRNGKVDTKYPCMSYRGPQWFEDRECARRLILKGFDGVSTDVECHVYNGDFHPMTIERFKAYLAERFPKLSYVDPHVFEADPPKHPDLHEAWVRFQGSLMGEYYESLREGMDQAARELKLARKPALTIYNDERYGRAGADLADLFSKPQPTDGAPMWLAPPMYYADWHVGNLTRDYVRRFPHAVPTPTLGRPTQGVTNQENCVYEAFANGARGFVMYAWEWNNGREVLEFAQGLGHIHKIEELFARARLLDAPYDPSESVRVRAVGDGDEKFVLVAQYAGHCSYLKKKLQPEVSFAIPTQGPARVTDLRTGALVAGIKPGANTVTLKFADFGVFPLYVKPDAAGK